MKRTITLFAIALTLTALTGCENKKQTEIENTVDPEKSRNEIMKLSEKFHAAYKAKNIQSIKDMLIIGNGVYCDTDPDEIFSREPFLQHLTKKLVNPAIGTIDYKIDYQDILIDDNGTGAMMIENYKINIFSQFIPWRMVSHVTWKDGTWKYDAISFAITPSNDVLPAVNAAAYKE